MTAPIPGASPMRTPRIVYALCMSPWLLIGLIGPWEFLVGIAVAGAVVIGVAGWLVDGDHVTIERDRP